MTHVLHLAALVLGLLAALATLPLCVELALAGVGRWFPPERGAHTPLKGSVAVLIPAHNEEALIARTVQSVLAAAKADPNPANVTVIAHNCTDQTAARAAEAGARVLPLQGPAGKGHALRHGMQAALKDGAAAIVVVDADTRVSTNLLTALRQALGHADAAQAWYELGEPAAHGRTGQELGALAFRGMNAVRPLGRESFGFSCGLFGNGFALKAETMAAVPWNAYGLAEDREYHALLVLARRRCAFVREARVWGVAAASRDARRSQRLRWEGGRIAMVRQMMTPLLRAAAAGNRHALEVLLDALSLPFAFGWLLMMVTLALSLFTGTEWLLVYALAGLALCLGYVLRSARLAPQPTRAGLALLAAPWFVLRKLWLLPAMLRSASRKAAWVRTSREAQP
jgi:cellulose synthase/poly-beta-1,6-N-acetylglucosamine synthase-like glycosyltransferase